jgi:hypothetical protein
VSAGAYPCGVEEVLGKAVGRKVVSSLFSAGAREIEPNCVTPCLGTWFKITPSDAVVRASLRLKRFQNSLIHGPEHRRSWGWAPSPWISRPGVPGSDPSGFEICQLNVHENLQYSHTRANTGDNDLENEYLE